MILHEYIHHPQYSQNCIISPSLYRTPFNQVQNNKPSPGVEYSRDASVCMNNSYIDNTEKPKPELRTDGDEKNHYTPVEVRGLGTSKIGRYHMNFFHGVSSVTGKFYLDPIKYRYVTSYKKMTDGSDVIYMNKDLDINRGLLLEYSSQLLGMPFKIKNEQHPGNIGDLAVLKDSAQVQQNAIPSHYKSENKSAPARRYYKQGLCHNCLLWVNLESNRNVPIKVPKIFWWRHTQKCHNPRPPNTNSPNVFERDNCSI
ncbi:Meiotic expression up-regulated protein 26 [Zancudomyces culisetae]|nr:Meiotic expression up-regulated protein 26 [Zancudomyces culisetae]|eukprot:OMH83586.1 Meiotic expression up-regulated protein 26 [Zancudomyces culisetae]